MSSSLSRILGGITAAAVSLCSAAAMAAALGTPSLSESSKTQLSIDVQFTAGTPGGAPAGFSLQWMTADAYSTNGGWYLSDDARLCKASFSGVPGYFAQNYNSYTLAAGESTAVSVGDLTFDTGASTSCDSPLVCGTSYVFRSFSHAVPRTSWKRSEFSADFTAATLPCTPPPAGCTLTQGYWKQHSAYTNHSNPNPLFGAKDEFGNLLDPTATPYITDWPVESLTLGSTSYTAVQLQGIFDKPAQGNGLISMTHQLIAAKLNIADGASDADIAASIAAADALIGALVVPPIGSGSLSPASTSALNAALTAYNEGTTGPGHCN
jgi:hypothetical protein